MPSESCYSGPIKFTDDRASVLCRHCEKEIERVTDYACVLYFPDDTGKENPIGPFCRRCMSEVKVCCGCNEPYFGDEVRYYENGIYYCNECVSSKETCGICNAISDTVEYDGIKYCSSCFENVFFKCEKCGDTHKKEFNCNSQLNHAMYPSVKFKDTCKRCFDNLVVNITPEDVKECEGCGSAYSGGGKYCSDCMISIPKCEFCDTVDHKYRIISSPAQSYVTCRKCKPVTCDNCKSLSIESMKETNDIFGTSKLCSTCSQDSTIGQCKSCLEVRSLGSDGLCEYCAEMYSNKCNKCNSLAVESSSTCRACGRGEVPMSQYSHKPTPIFHYTDKDVKEGDNCFMGFENEVIVDSGNKDDALRGIFSKMDHTKVNCKDDGSIQGIGFEIVSHPYTLRAFNKEKWTSVYKNITSHSSCGVHIHFDRRCLSSKTHLYKIINFIHENEKFSNVVAGRKFTSYQKKINKKPSEAVKDNSTSRYQRVNLLNENTVEIRMFASAPTHYRMARNMEFVHALVNYTRNASIKECSSFKGFNKYVKSNKKMYKKLNRFLSSPMRYWNK